MMDANSIKAAACELLSAVVCRQQTRVHVRKCVQFSKAAWSHATKQRHILLFPWRPWAGGSSLGFLRPAHSTTSTAMRTRARVSGKKVSIWWQHALKNPKQVSYCLIVELSFQRKMCPSRFICKFIFSWQVLRIANLCLIWMING